MRRAHLPLARAINPQSEGVGVECGNPLKKGPTKGRPAGTPCSLHCHSISQFPQLNCKIRLGRRRDDGGRGGREGGRRGTITNHF